MKTLLDKLIINYPYFAAVILFLIGAFTVLTRSNLFKKLIGINIMESAIFLMFIAAGNIRGGTVPILRQSNPEALYINPVPSALMLTGIVVSVSVTAFALALIIRLYQSYGTTDVRRIAEMKREVT
jgi:multicomponent Na+:H+ antiporter subunit C